MGFEFTPKKVTAAKAEVDKLHNQLSQGSYRSPCIDCDEYEFEEDCPECREEALLEAQSRRQAAAAEKQQRETWARMVAEANGDCFSTLEPNEVGLEYDSVALKLNDDKLFETGRHYIGVGKRFFKYPKSLQTVTLSGLEVRSGDGLAISVDVAFTYRIASTVRDLVALYLSFGEVDQVDTLYSRIATSAVRDAAAKFSAFAFITNRTAVATEMELLLNQQIIQFQGSSQTFQLLNFVFPPELEASINAQAQAQEDAAQALEALARATVNANGIIARAPNEAQLLVQASRADAAEITQNNQAAINQVQSLLRAEALSYRQVAATLALSDAELLTFIWLDALNAQKRPLRMVLDTPPVLQAAIAGA